MNQRYLTLSEQNQFRFACPIFEVEVKFAQCMQIIDSVMVGKVLPVRRGCQACISDSKCPAREVVRKICFQKDVPDDYGSATPVVGKVRRDILERIAPVVAQSRTIERYGVPSAELNFIETSGARIRKMIDRAPVPSRGYVPTRTYDTGSTERAARTARASKAAAPAKPTKSDTVNNAAATGDLAAAIS